MQLLALGLNHTTAPIALRERVAFNGEEVGAGLQSLHTFLAQHLPPNQAPIQTQVALVSTCNRTEIYAAFEATEGVTQDINALILQWLCSHKHVNTADLAAHLYTLVGEQAIRHPFSVASGLDSMVLGETQILGQMKEAARAAQAAGTLGTQLHQLFQKSFAVAKIVRTETAIGRASVSMAAASVRLAQKLFGELNTRRVLLVGAGEMIQLLATHIAGYAPAHMTVANRSATRGDALLQHLQSSVTDKTSLDTLPLSALPDHLHEFDIVVSCTASSLPIIGLGMVKNAIAKRKHAPMMMIDLAVPRDIEPEVAKLADVFLYTVDDLGRVVQTGQASRQAAVAQAESIIAQGVSAFEQWLRDRETAPQVQALRTAADTMREAELAKAMKRLAAGEAAEAVLSQFSTALMNKLLHREMQRLKENQ